MLVSRFTNSNATPIGTVISSMLTEVQFQAINGTTWILADGRSIVGSQYATATGNTTAPDLRGQYIRGKNNGRVDGNQDPAGERTLGTFQADAFENHFHDVSSGSGNGSFSSGGLFASTPNGGADNIITQGAVTSPGVPDPKTLSGETRVKNVVFNMFIKINA